MALSNPRPIFGIHTITPYRRSDRTPYGVLRVLGNGTFSLEGENIELRGGSLVYPWAVESGDTTAQIQLNLKEYPDFVIQLFLGKAPTPFSAEASGNVGTASNVSGATVIDATNGISGVSATASEEADLKFGIYVIKATGANTVNLYTYSNIDFTRGTEKEFQDDTLKLLAADLTIAVGANTVAGFGLTLTGVGTPAFNTGDTASFEVRPINGGGSTVKIGSTKDTFVEFGAHLITQKQSNGQLFEIDVFRAKGNGIPLGGEEKSFREGDVTASVFYDSAKDGIANLRIIDQS